jgi:hypothetical protein
MNLGPSELGILGVLLLIFLGGSLKKSSKPSTPTEIYPKKESDPKANFQQNNTDYDNKPIKKSY